MPLSISITTKHILVVVPVVCLACQIASVKASMGHPAIAFIHPRIHTRNHEATWRLASKPWNGRDDEGSHAVESVRHQVEHRAKDKLGFGLAGRLSEEFTKVGDRLAEESLERLAEKGLPKLSKEAAEQMVKSTISKQIVSSSSRRAVERTTDALAEKIAGAEANSMLRSVPVSAEKLVEKHLSAEVAEHAAEKVGAKLARNSASEALSKSLEQVAGRHMSADIVEHAAEKAGARLSKKATPKTLSKSVASVAERYLSADVAEHAAEKAGSSLARKTASDTISKAVGKVAQSPLERISERVAEGLDKLIDKWTLSIFGHSSDVIIRRSARTLALAIPILGGLFAFYLCISDCRRLRQEMESKCQSSVLLFSGAALADMTDTVIHFWMAQAAIRSLHSHALVIAEQGSLLCAIISTVFAILGELTSIKGRRNQENSPAARH